MHDPWTERQLLRLVLWPIVCLGPPAAGLLVWWLMRAVHVLPGGPLSVWVPIGAGVLAACVSLFTICLVMTGVGLGAEDQPPPSAIGFLAQAIWWAFLSWTGPLWLPLVALFAPPLKWLRRR
jgi:hypothetical protein